MIVDCHRHLGGCISPAFVWKMATDQNMHWLGDTYEDIVNAMQFGATEIRDFQKFLSKFEILNSINWTEDLVADSIKQVCDDMIADGIQFCWMHFTINKYVEKMGWPRKDIIKFVCNCFEKYAPNRIGPILCLKYESPKANQRQIAALVEDDEIAAIVDGIDLVGDESCYDASFYKSILEPWVARKKAVFAHVGESCSAKNIGTAIELGVTEICHGIKLYQYPGLLTLAREHDVCFHMALTSNIMTGLTDLDHHPIVSFLEDGLKVTIGTDDPIQCSTNITKEYSLLKNYLTNANLSPDRIEKLIERVRDCAVENIMKYGKY